MTVEFRYARVCDYTSISEFLAQYWAKDYVYVRQPELFRWTFGRSNLWDHDGYSFAVMEDRSELVGILGAIPFLFNSFGKTSRAVWFANLMVRADYRKGPLALHLLGMFRRPPFTVNAVAGINAKAITLYQKLRWKLLGPMPRHFAVTPYAVKRMTELVRLTHSNLDVHRAKSLVRFFTTDLCSESPSGIDDRLPTTWDRDNWTEIASRTIGAARDSDYLNWRYLKHPCFEYRLKTRQEGNRTGLAIWRLETIRVLTAIGPVEVDRIGRLVEFLPVSRCNARELFLDVWKDLSNADALGVDYYGYHEETAVWLQELGFLRTDKHPDGQNLPSRFQPLDGKGDSIMTAVMMSSDDSSCLVNKDNLWYWTKSDGDQDRPN
jgi:hypothetical protein